MTLSVRTHPLAAVELTEAVRWYESKRPGLGAELFDEIAKRRPGYWKHRQ